jgi:hypothetical protein
MAENDNNNPRNPESPLFKRLTRLFSGPIVNYRQQAIFRGRSQNTQKYTFRSNTGKSFKRREHFNPFEGVQAKILQGQRREQRYTDFEQMEFTPEIASSLDVYADEITTSTSVNPLLRVDCSNEEIKAIIHTLLYNVLNIEFNLFNWARSMCKYGDYFLYLDIDEEKGVINTIPLPVREVERVEGTDPTNPSYIQYYWGAGQEGVTFENWQIGHFRVLGNDLYAPYGTSVLEPARRIWRQLTLVEDAMMAYRVVRSPERRVFYIDVGGIPPNEIEQYMEQVKTQMKRNQVIDADTGRVDLRYNPTSIDEDYYIPVRGDTSSRVDTLAGGSITGDIDDVKYLRDKLFSALKIPMAYLAQSESMEDTTTLAQKDIRFARTIQRLQRIVVAELEKVVIIHLYTLGFRGEDLMSFKLGLNNPSKIAELQELEHLNSKFDIAGAATEGFFSKRWVYKKIFNLSDEEIERILSEQFFDKKHEALLEAIAGEVTADSASMGGGSGGGMDDPLGEDEPDLGGEEGEDPGGEEAAEEGDETLLAAPGKRDGYLTPGAKGKVYTPATVDQRKHTGPRRRHLNSVGGRSRTTKKDLFPGLKKNLTLGRGIANEVLQQKEEKLLFEASHEVKRLIKELEERDGTQP